MDPFTLAVNLMTVVQLATKVISSTTAYGKNVQDLPDEVQVLVSEISLLSGVLNQLGSLLHSATDKESVLPVTFSADVLQPAMNECQKQLETLHTFLEKGRRRRTRIKNLGRRLKWPMKGQETREWIARMERFKGSFSLALQSGNLGAQQKICGEMEEIKVAQEADRVEKKLEGKSEFCSKRLRKGDC